MHTLLVAKAEEGRLTRRPDWGRGLAMRGGCRVRRCTDLVGDDVIPLTRYNCPTRRPACNA